MEQEEKLCDEVEAVKKFTYFGDRVSAGGEGDIAVTTRATYGLCLRSVVSCCMAGEIL